jgi:putative endopeptidase
MLRPALFMAFLGLAFPGSAYSAPAQPPPAASDGLMVSAIDPSVPPCENFYLHACKGWLAANPIPPDQARWGVDDVLIEQNRLKLRAILEQAAASPDPESRKIGDFWTACMDESGIEAKGLAPLQPELDRIDALGDKADLAALVAHLHRIDVDVLFDIGSDQDYADATQVIAEADQGGLGLPERKYYLGTGKEADATRAAYLAHLGRVLALAGTAEPDAAAEAVMALETRLAKISLSDVERRDPTKVYHKLAVGDLDKLAPGFGWTAYLRDVGVPPVTSLNVAVPGFFQGLQAILAETPLDAIKLYLRAHLLQRAADMLPKRFVDENFDFFGRTMAGAKELRPRWKRCVGYTDNALGEDLGKIYVREAFGPEAKASIAALVQHLREAYAADIQSLPWMGKETKAKAEAKLQAMVEKIGYPDKWRDYSKLEIRSDDALGNRLRAGAFESDREFAKIGKPVDKGEWAMTPPTVNAYYDDQKNDINFPAGILQPPNFDARWDDAINYGAIGATIGHEMTHGFDDAGRLFDAAGNLQDWWSKSDAKQFKTRARCLVAEYGGFSVAPGVKLDGNLTLGENTADNGGTRLAYLALEQALSGKKTAEIDGYRPEQRFFLAYAQSWCENQTPEGAKLQALTDPHSTAEYRVNGVVANMPEFRRAFQCQPGAKMAPAKACRVW